jgi:glutamyl-tRNA(Gln) amidotransferase subunit E
MIDYEKLGLKVGLEIHQQLDTLTKLFCHCKPKLFKEKPEITFLRRLRPTQSELGQIDPAAYFEFQKGMKILYEASMETSCLVEMDEEPPHPLNMEAVKIALTVALMMKATPVEEIHVMRKTVIDGSNTTGFQRTCVIALNGKIKVDNKTIPIEHISLEEDAARKTGEENNTLRYRIDRLGIPLIEIATAPTITSPKEAGEVALAIGKILRATGKVKRGIGTIRQDLNISIPNGALIEIKGVQELELIPIVIEYEIQRQLSLLQISKELRKKGVKKEFIKEEFFDVTHIFKQTKCKVIRKALEKNGQVLAAKLPNFGGFLKKELIPNIRLGTEMADRAKFWGRVGGIFHTDEMPAYGITAKEIEELRKTIKARQQDVVVFVAHNPENARDALRAVIERAREALQGVPEETRAAKPDGTTRYMRPRPGAARMYPETDIPVTEITKEHIKAISTSLPELPEEKLKRLMRNFKLNKKLAKQIIDSKYDKLFEVIMKESHVPSTIVAVFLTETLKALKRDGVPVENLSYEQIQEIFRYVDKGKLTKEAISDVAIWLSKNREKKVQDAINSLGLTIVSEDYLLKIIDSVIEEFRDQVEELGMHAFKVIMGRVMREVHGKAEASSVAQLVKVKLKHFLSKK